ncbi:MAG: hypothetical protein JRJ38_07155 [Deltaproteobacteria bacterium]|nr:hypothetical protein [Deltaproteobacteria bacterium]
MIRIKKKLQTYLPSALALFWFIAFICYCGENPNAGDVQMLFKPKWVKLLPPYLRPEKKQMNELEILRTRYDIPHDALALRIMSSPATTRKIQRQSYEYLRTQYPELSEKELLKKVLISRMMAPPSYGITEKEIDQAMENINSFDDLCKYIISFDEQEPAFPDPLGIGKRIDEILIQEELGEILGSDLQS